MYRHGSEEIEAAARVLRSGQWFRYGDPEAGHLGEAAAFESAWAATVGSPHAGLVSSGTAALMCCFAGLELGPGDEVIIPGYTWIASALAPLSLGVIPVIVDVDASLTIDPAAVERAITPRTRAINPVHMNGLACDLDALREIARRRGLRIIEDACQADGGRWRGTERLGAVGDMGAYSFNQHKVIACGDGGAYVARSREDHERALMFHDGGCIFRPHAKDLGIPPFCGINLRGNEILAAIMRAQLARLDGILADLARVRARMEAALAGDGIALIPRNGGPGAGVPSHLGFTFADAEPARAFCGALATASGGRLNPQRPLESGRHLYRNWTPVIEERGATVAARDAYRLPANAAQGPRHAELPRTLDILARTVLMPLHCDWTDAEADAHVEEIRACTPVAR